MKPIALRILLLCLLAMPALAAPRIAIITPVQGRPALAGKSLSGPAFAQEGQMLELPAGSQVRVQLLGSSKQTTLKGPNRLTLSKTALEATASRVQRTKLSVAQEAGNLQRSAAVTTRASKPLGLTLRLPGKATEGGWEFPLQVDAQHFQPKQDIAVTLGELGQAGQTYLLEAPGQSLHLQGLTLTGGRRYLLVVQGQSLQYKRVFQLLSDEEKNELEKLERDILGKQPTLAQLLNAANLWNDFDQTDAVARLLEKAVSSPEFRKRPEAEQMSILDALNRALESLDRAACPRDPRG